MLALDHMAVTIATVGSKKPNGNHVVKFYRFRQSHREVPRWEIFMDQELIWAGFGPVGITGKKFGPIMSKFCGRFFKFWWAKRKLKTL